MKNILVVSIFLLHERRMALLKVHWAWRLALLTSAYWGTRSSSFGWPERADLITFLGLTLFVLHWDAHHAEGRWRLTRWIWSAAFMVWANSHPGFVLGLVVAVLYTLGEWIETRRITFATFLWVTSCLLATLINPSGTNLYRSILAGVAQASSVNEWARTPWIHFQVFWAWLGFFWLTAATVAVRLRSIPWAHLFVALFLSWAAVRHIFDVPFFTLCAVPYAIAWFERTRSNEILLRPLNRHAAGALVLALVLATAANLQALSRARGGVMPGLYPEEACNFVAQNNIAGPFYNEYESGGYWMWRFNGNPAVFIDGRSPTVQGYAALWDEIKRSQGGLPADWNHFLEKYKVNAALVTYPASTPFPSTFELYFPRREWALVYWDDQWLLFVRRIPENQKVIQASEFSSLFPDARDVYFIGTYQKGNSKQKAAIQEELSRNLSLHPDSHRTHHLLEIIHA